MERNTFTLEWSILRYIKSELRYLICKARGGRALRRSASDGNHCVGTRKAPPILDEVKGGRSGYCVGRSWRRWPLYPPFCAEMVNPSLDAEPIREVSCGAVEGGEALGFGRVVLGQLPHNEKAVTNDFERPPIVAFRRGKPCDQANVLGLIVGGRWRRETHRGAPDELGGISEAGGAEHDCSSTAGAGVAS
jgi:hypothetical protein